MNKTKKLYFTNDFSPENVEKLQGDGWILRDRSACHEGDFVENADEYGGDVPEWYKPKVEKITVQLTTEISPELQKTIDDAKAECEKVVAENVELKEQLVIAQSELITFKNDVGAMQARIIELQSVDYSKLKVDDLKDVLKLKGIDFPSDAKKDDLIALLPKE